MTVCSKNDISHNLFYRLVLSLIVAAIGFLNTNLTIFEGDEVNFTIGVLQGYLDTTVTILFTAEASSAQGNLLNSTVQHIKFMSTF